MTDDMTNKEIEELIKEEKREYARNWRKENKEKVRANNQRYWKKKALEKLKEQEKKTV